MRWPWSRPERRSATYTRAILDAFHAAAAEPATAATTAALEACSGFVARSFAAAEVQAPDALGGALSPALLALIGRALIRRGEVALLISTTGGRLALLPVESHTVEGGADPASWRYRVTVSGPSRIGVYREVPAAAVVHPMYARDPARPWLGIGPLQAAALAGRLSAATVESLTDESGRTRGAFLPLPVDGDDPTVAALKADVGNARGRLLTVQAGDWDSGESGGRAMYRSERFGADPPAALVQLMAQSSREVMAACGLSPALFDDSDGTSKREGYRQALHSTVAPLGRIVSDELSRKLDAPIVLDWTELRAADIAGRARAFQSLVGGGMPADQAAAASGILTPPDP